MRTFLYTFAAVAFACTGCGDNTTGQVKGRLIENGEPKTFPPTSYSIEFALVGPTDPEKMKLFTAVVDTDGSFQVHASGGKLPVGEYLVRIRQPTSKRAPVQPPLKREIKPGMNEFTLDLAKPELEASTKK